MRRYLIEKKNPRSCSAPDSSEASVNGTGSDPTDVVGSATRRKFEWRMVWPNKPGPVQARAGSGRAVHEVNLKVVHGQIFVSVSFGAEIFGAVFVKMPPKKIFGRAEIFLALQHFLKGGTVVVAGHGGQGSKPRPDWRLSKASSNSQVVEMRRNFERKKIMVGILEQ